MDTFHSLILEAGDYIFISGMVDFLHFLETLKLFFKVIAPFSLVNCSSKYLAWHFIYLFIYLFLGVFVFLLLSKCS